MDCLNNNNDTNDKTKQIDIQNLEKNGLSQQQQRYKMKQCNKLPWKENNLMHSFSKEPTNIYTNGQLQTNAQESISVPISERTNYQRMKKIYNQIIQQRS